jgi:two-component sensor histidine kinase
MTYPISKSGEDADATGTLDMTSKADGEKIVLTWLERGGPPVTPPDGNENYGSKLVQRSVRPQLGGTIDYEWSAEGLIVTICMERSRLSS